MLVGFVHGVMNTDNVSVAGETIDYGHVHFLMSIIRRQCLAQLIIKVDMLLESTINAQWNLARLAESLVQAVPEIRDAVGKL